MAVTYGSNHLLFRWGGNFGVLDTDTIEAWSCGVRIFIGPGPFTEAAKSTFLTSVQAAVDAFHVHIQASHAGTAWLKKLTAAYIGVDGHYVGGDTQPTTQYIYAAPKKGTGVSDLPYSHATAYTLRSDLPRGRGHVGRFYMPSGMRVDTSGRYTAAAALNGATAAKTLIDALNTTARTTWSPASAVSIFSGLGTGQIGTVMAVGVGRAPDTQRRRDNNILEEHQYVDLGTTLLRSQQLADVEYEPAETQ